MWCQDRVPVPEFMGQFHFDRYADPMLNGIFRHKACVRSRTACYNDYFIDRPENIFTDMDFIKVKAVLHIETPQKGILYRRGLLMDLLVHEGIPSALFRSRHIPVNSIFSRLRRVAVKISDRNSICADHDGFVLPKLKGFLRIRNKSCNIRPKEVLPVPDPHDERGIMARTDYYIRLAHIYRQKGKCAGDHTRCAAHSLEKVRPAFLADDLVLDLAQKLCSHLSICTRRKMVSLRLKLEFKLGRIFNNAIVDKGNTPVFTGMGMRIRIAGYAVRRPSRMPNTNSRILKGMPLYIIDKVIEPAFFFTHSGFAHTRGRQGYSR